MLAVPGYVPSGTQGDPLSNYQRSRLGRWEVAKNIDPDDSAFGIELKTPAGPIRIRFETTINGKSFRAAREKTIDELLAIAKGEQNIKAEPIAEEPKTEEPKTEELKNRQLKKTPTKRKISKKTSNWNRRPPLMRLPPKRDSKRPKLTLQHPLSSE